MLEFYPQPLLLIFAPAFTLGILHTLMPCEDKAIFFFWSFGISKTLKKSVYILVLYGLGLMTSNMVLATITILISFIPRLLIPGIHQIPPNIINFFGAMTSMFAGFILLLFYTSKGYMPHSKRKDEIFEFNWEKKKTPYLFGILAGFAPCIFEFFIYSQCLTYSLGAWWGFIDGIFTVFYFSLGTFIGLFPLALAKHGTSQIMKSTSSKRNWTLITMFVIIILVNTLIMILSFLGVYMFPESTF
ncbi:MAG: sulfite exporter TauE/SafE family protein [Promethearchaeota archaeon]